MDRFRVVAFALRTLLLVALTSPVEADATPVVLVSDRASASVYRFNAATGDFIDVFASHPGLTNTQNLAIGPDGNLYVADASTGIYRFNGQTGEFIDHFVDHVTDGLAEPTITPLFGPDGNLYITSDDEIRRYNAASGALLDVFATSPDSVSVFYPIVFGPDGDLYGGRRGSSDIERYDGNTGAFIDVFIDGPTTGLDDPRQMIFHTDGLLYVISEDSQEVLRYDGTTGAFVDVFVSSSELAESNSIWFGPNGNLFATSRFHAHVFEFDGATGAEVGVFATAPGMTRPTWALYVVPEPATGLLVGFGLAALGVWGRRRGID